MINYMDNKLTPNQAAKALIMSKVSIATEFWYEDSSLDYEALTEREKQEIQKYINQQEERLLKLFGINQCGEKV